MSRLDITSLLPRVFYEATSHIMTTLFPTMVETNVTEPSNVVTPPVLTNKDKNAAVESSEMASKTASSSSSVNGNGNLLINWDFIGEISKALESYTNRNDENLKSLFLGKKVDLKGHISSITDDASRLVDDFRTLMSLLHTSEYDSKALAEIGELLKSMEARRPQIEALTNLLVGKNDDSVVVDSEEKGDDKNSDINVEDEDSETEDSAAVEAEPNPSNKGKGKNEKKSNSKKGNSAAEEVETNPSKKGKGNNKNKNKPKKGKGGKKKR